MIIEFVKIMGCIQKVLVTLISHKQKKYKQIVCGFMFPLETKQPLSETFFCSVLNRRVISSEQHKWTHCIEPFET
jgi:hypothetical protein